MKFLSITVRGLEKQCNEEIKELLNVDGKILDHVVEFSCNVDDIAKYSYMTQGSLKILELISSGNVKDVFDLNYDGDLGKSFCVKCKRIGEHDFNSQKIEQIIGARIYEKLKVHVDLKRPETLLYVFIVDDKYFFGKDICGYDISKRDYKIMNNQFSIKGTLGFLMLKFAGYKRNEILLNPFIRSGEIVIEAALYNLNRSVNYFLKNKFKFDGLEKYDEEQEASFKSIYAYSDNPKYIVAVQKNAKIAEVHKLLNFSRLDIDWIDTKFEKESVDKIVTLFSKIKITTEKNFHKALVEFFHQADYCLKKDGVIVVLTRNSDEFVDDKFEIVDKIKLENQTLIRMIRKKF